MNIDMNEIERDRLQEFEIDRNFLFSPPYHANLNANISSNNNNEQNNE